LPQIYLKCIFIGMQIINCSGKCYRVSDMFIYKTIVDCWIQKITSVDSITILELYSLQFNYFKTVKRTKKGVFNLRYLICCYLQLPLHIFLASVSIYLVSWTWDMCRKSCRIWCWMPPALSPFYRNCIVLPNFYTVTCEYT